jgi:hypothetical protein
MFALPGDGTPDSWFFGRAQDGREGNFPGEWQPFGSSDLVVIVRDFVNALCSLGAGTYVRKIRLRPAAISIDVEGGGEAKAVTLERTASPEPHPPTPAATQTTPAKRELQPHEYKLYQVRGFRSCWGFPAFPSWPLAGALRLQCT